MKIDLLATLQTQTARPSGETGDKSGVDFARFFFGEEGESAKKETAKATPSKELIEVTSESPDAEMGQASEPADDDLLDELIEEFNPPRRDAAKRDGLSFDVEDTVNFAVSAKADEPGATQKVMRHLPRAFDEPSENHAQQPSTVVQRTGAADQADNFTTATPQKVETPRTDVLQDIRPATSNKRQVEAAQRAVDSANGAELTTHSEPADDVGAPDFVRTVPTKDSASKTTAKFNAAAEISLPAEAQISLREPQPATKPIVAAASRDVAQPVPSPQLWPNIAAEAPKPAAEAIPVQSGELAPRGKAPEHGAVTTTRTPTQKFAFVEGAIAGTRKPNAIGKTNDLRASEPLNSQGEGSIDPSEAKLARAVSKAVTIPTSSNRPLPLNVEYPSSPDEGAPAQLNLTKSSAVDSAAQQLPHPRTDHRAKPFPMTSEGLSELRATIRQIAPSTPVYRRTSVSGSTPANSKPTLSQPPLQPPDIDHEVASDQSSTDTNAGRKVVSTAPKKTFSAAHPVSEARTPLPVSTATSDRVSADAKISRVIERSAPIPVAQSNVANQGGQSSQVEVQISKSPLAQPDKTNTVPNATTLDLRGSEQSTVKTGSQEPGPVPSTPLVNTSAAQTDHRPVATTVPRPGNHSELPKQTVRPEAAVEEPDAPNRVAHDPRTKPMSLSQPLQPEPKAVATTHPMTPSDAQEVSLPKAKDRTSDRSTRATRDIQTEPIPSRLMPDAPMPTKPAPMQTVMSPDIAAQLGSHDAASFTEALLTESRVDPARDLQTTALHRSITRPDLAPKLTDQIVTLARAATDGPVEITLRPEELGRVRMHLVTTDQAVTLTITAERQETLDLMRRNTDQLIQEYRDLGYEDVKFAFAFNDQTSGGSDNGAEGDRPESALSLDQTTDITEPETPQPGLADGVDIRL